MNTNHKFYKKMDVIHCFNRGRKKYDPQAAMAYIIYMMVGSAYNRSRICSTIVEERLRFEYMKMPLAEQYEAEEHVISWMNQMKITETVGDLRCIVYMCVDENDYLVTFETFFGKLEFRIDRSGAAFQLRVDRK
jgi:hypothetical protein